MHNSHMNSTNNPKDARELVRLTIKDAVLRCEIRTLAELNRRARESARQALRNLPDGAEKEGYNAIHFWSDDQFRKCLADGHKHYNYCIKLFSKVFAETGHAGISSAEWHKRLLESSPMERSTGQTGTQTSLQSVAIEDSVQENALWKPYKQKLQNLFEFPLPGTNVSLSSVYVPLRAKYNDTLSRSPHLVSFLSRKQQRHEENRMNFVRAANYLANTLKEWTAGNLERHDAVRLVRGGPGSGKSTFTKAIASGATFDFDEKRYCVAHTLLISLQYIPSSIETAEEMIKWHVEDKENFPFGVPSLSNFSPNSRLLVIFDGLDELSGGGQTALKRSQKFLESLENWLAVRNRHDVNTLGLVLGRDVVIQKAEVSLSLAHHQTLLLLPFRVDETGLLGDKSTLLKDQRKEWWRKWAAATGLEDSFLPREFDSKGLSELSSEPLLLFIIGSTKIYQIDGLDSCSRYEIYQLILNRVLSNWHNKTAEGSSHFATDPGLLKEIEMIACAAWDDGGRATTISKAELYSIEKGSESTGINSIFKERDLFKALFAFYLRLTDGGNKEDVGIEFSHKSFCEFFIARRLLRQIATAADEGDSFLGSNIRISTAPDGFRGINQVISSFLEDGIRSWPQENKQKASRIAENTLHELFGRRSASAKNTMENIGAAAQLATEVALVVLNYTRQKEGRILSLDWENGYSAKAFFEVILRVQSCSDWSWRHRYTSLVPDQVGICAIRVNYTDFSGQVLAGMRFVGMNFFGSSFLGCDLRGTHFIDCIVCSVDFTGANLQGTVWNGSNVSGCSFDEALIHGADFSYANGRGRKQLLSAIGHPEAKLSIEETISKT